MTDTSDLAVKLPADFGVAVTRPREQAETLCRMIEDAGGRAIRLPLLAIEALEPECAGAARLRRLDDVDWLVFISANAVRFGLEHLPPNVLEGTKHPHIAAIGEATRGALELRGLAVDLAPKAQFNSEALLAQPEWSDMRGQRVLIVRGEGGRELLAETLRARGAEVEYAEVYRRIWPPLDVAYFLSLAQSAALGALVVTSGEALEHLAGQLGTAALERIARIPVIVVSERLAQAARDLGFQNPVVASAASDRAIFDTAAGIAAARPGSSRQYQNYGDTALVDEDKELTLNDEAPVTETEPADRQGDDRPSPPPRGKRLAAWLGYGALLLTVVLVAAGVFLLQELRSKQEGLGGELNKGDQQMLELTHQITGLQSELAALHNQFATLQSQVSTEDSKFEREIGEQGTAFGEKLDTLRSDLEGSVGHIQRQLNKSRGDLLVADAEYLLSIANQKLHLVGDVKSVLAAMEAADQRLHDSGDPAAFKVREALAEEISLLRKFDAPDIVGLSAKLLAMETKVKDLPLFLPHAGMAKTRDGEQTKEAVAEPKPEGGGLIDSTLDDIRDLVTVRRSDRPIQAILEPQQAESLRQVMLLKLEMTRAALLRGDDAFYKANLESARAWLDEHFDRAASVTQTMSEELQTLRAVQIRIPFPDVSKSLSLLRNIEKLRLEAEEHPTGTRKPTVESTPPAAAPSEEATKAEPGVSP